MGKTSKLLRKRERNGKDPSRASTKEMAVKLEQVLAVWLVWKHFSVQKWSSVNWPLAGGLWPVLQRLARRGDGV